jgi:hypothetical protein
VAQPKRHTTNVKLSLIEETMPFARQGAAAALHAPEQRDDITKHRLHKLVQHHGSH